ncbi:sugar-phosphatase [Silvimonas terrae]|uniref:Sugar-phosphatase n=1 Tax=Silvimonas terrae TaxID=300266 RepID=A0A840RBX0_9NEIS|nr:HAD-IA family hydrolase [Silvimonas terrae]MBB5190064.1 sugar-phosphatase [Silvimonas terrae]
MQQHRAQAFLFDMDGTLIDSHILVERVWEAWCARCDLNLDDIRQYTHGVRTEDTVRMVAPHLDVVAEVAWMEEIETDTTGGIAPVPGADTFLQQMPAGRWAVVTSASRPVLDVRFAACNMQLPDVVVTSEEVDRGKPAPDPYLLAAKRLGVDPRQCIVFEDAPAGMASALAAGCKVVLVGDFISDEPGVIGHITDFAQLEFSVDGDLVLSAPAPVLKGLRAIA